MGRRHVCRSRCARRLARNPTVRTGRRRRRRHLRLHGRLHDHLPFALRVLHGLAAVVRNGTNGRSALDRTDQDGYFVVTTNSAQQFQDFLVMIERADLVEDADLAQVAKRFARRDEFLAAVHDHTQSRTTAELLEEAALLRIPAAPVLDAAGVLAFEHFRDRAGLRPLALGSLRPAPGPLPRLRPRAASRSPRRPLPANTTERSTGRTAAPLRARRRTVGSRSAGIRVVDCTAWWAGPSATNVLAALGADVVKIESVERPDQMRFSSTRRPPAENWWEWGPIFHAVNTGKRGVTDRPRGRGWHRRVPPPAPIG